MTIFFHRFFGECEKTYTFVSQSRKREHSSVGSERLPYKQRVGGSNPSAPTKRNAVKTTQMGGFCFLTTLCKLVCKGSWQKQMRPWAFDEAKFCIIDRTSRGHKPIGAVIPLLPQSDKEKSHSFEWLFSFRKVLTNFFVMAHYRKKIVTFVTWLCRILRVQVKNERCEVTSHLPAYRSGTYL